MSLVLANITSLWKQIFTNVMQSPLSSLILFQSHSALTAGTALITVHHTPHCLASSPRFLTNACTYLCIFHSLSFQNGHGPQGRDHPLQCAVLPLYWFLQMQLRENSHHLFLPRRGWSLLDTFPIISRVLRNTLTSTRTWMKGHCRNTFTVPSLCSSAFYSSWCREIECIDCFTQVYSAPLLSEPKSHGVSGGWGWVQH